MKSTDTVWLTSKWRLATVEGRLLLISRQKVAYGPVDPVQAYTDWRVMPAAEAVREMARLRKKPLTEAEWQLIEVFTGQK